MDNGENKFKDIPEYLMDERERMVCALGNGEKKIGPCNKTILFENIEGGRQFIWNIKEEIPESLYWIQRALVRFIYYKYHFKSPLPKLLKPYLDQVKTEDGFISDEEIQIMMDKIVDDFKIKD